MDQLLFQHLCEEYAARERNPSGIGTLSEKTIHAVLKDYMDSNPVHQEQPLLGYVADIFDGSAVVEVQTRSFDRLRGKLSAFLDQVPVTVVHPIPDTKWLIWVNQETGEQSVPRKSPKSGNILSVMKELYKVKSYLKNPNLHFHFLFLDMNEYRLLNGYSTNRKKGSTRLERIPSCITHEITIDTPEDYQIFLPDTLPDTFTSADLQKQGHVTLSTAQTSLNILTYMETVTRIGKEGNRIQYQKTFH